jgi:hypothetical protein
MAYACSESDNNVQPPSVGALSPGKKVLLTPRDFEVLDYYESLLTPPATDTNSRLNSDRRVVESPSTIQLVRDRLKRSFKETNDVNREDNIIISRGRFQARTGGDDLVIQ